MKLPWGRA